MCVCPLPLGQRRYQLVADIFVLRGIARDVSQYELLAQVVPFERNLQIRLVKVEHMSLVEQLAGEDNVPKTGEQFVGGHRVLDANRARVGGGEQAAATLSAIALGAVQTLQARVVHAAVRWLRRQRIVSVPLLAGTVLAAAAHRRPGGRGRGHRRLRPIVVEQLFRVGGAEHWLRLRPLTTARKNVCVCVGNGKMKRVQG